jgi:hypothetical protein
LRLMLADLLEPQTAEPSVVSTAPIPEHSEAPQSEEVFER